MRLLQVIPIYDSYASFLRELAAAWVDAGNEVLTVCDCRQRLLPTAIDDSFPLQHMDFPRGSHPLKQWRTAQQLRAICKDFKPDIVHAHFSAGILCAALARGQRGRSQRPVWMGTFQGLQFPLASGFNRHILRYAECFAAARMDCSWVLSMDDAAALQMSAPRAAVRLQQSAGFGCRDLFHDAIFPDAQMRQCLRSKLEILAGATIFLFVGRLVDFKGFSVAARAFLQARQQRQDIHWLVVGDRDPLHPCALSTAEWDHLRADPNVHLLGPQADVLPIYDAADALLFPSTREGMSVCIMEALARRLPVLTNRARGCKELIDDGKNGIFFASNTVNAVRDQLLAFTPFRGPVPNPRTRRSAWIKEMLSAYSSATT